ncbi:Magnesium transporter MRS2-1 [Ananas comosus]|uniref:Magnesium transporter n=1 Tax=Ananas comosus TaxID=4615 RepID=A0A199UJX5_ANACO|nr:Magnesium transporter MRS2-1 [Ananas comosus]
MANLKDRLLPLDPLHHRRLPQRRRRRLLRRGGGGAARRRGAFHGMDALGLKKRGQSVRAWIRVHAATGESHVIQRAIVVNLEQVRCIITADEVLLLNSPDGFAVQQYIAELRSRLATARGGDGDGDGDGSPDYLPFEFLALEVALEAACTFLDAQVRDEIEQLMDDDGDMAEMFLTEKKQRMEASFLGEQSLNGFSNSGPGISVSAPVSPVSSPPESRKLEKTFSFARSRHDSFKSSDSSINNIEVLEMLLEAYFVVIDNTLNKLTSLKEYIDDTEDFINIQLDNVRNQLIQFELLLTTATFVVAIFGVIAGVFGMNFQVPLFEESGAFQWVLIISGACGVIIFCSFLWYFKRRRFIPL